MRGKEFQEWQIGLVYEILCQLRDWMKETGLTIDDAIEYLDTHMAKK